MQVAEATQALKDGHVVAIPTETVYGLAANATLARTLRKIYEIKNRPLQNPLICHCRDTEEISQYAFLSPLAHKLFPLWPGPLTLVLPSKRLLPKEVNNGSDWLAFRIPNHPLSLRILQALPFPLAMPSANLSGRESPTSVGMVRDQLADRIYGAVAGHCQAGIESTIVQVLPDHVRLLRLGALPLEKIQQSIGTAKIETQHNGQSGKNPAPSSQQLVAPGSRYKHYAPKAPLLLLSDSAITTTQLFKEQASRGKIFRSLYLDKTKDNEAKKNASKHKGNHRSDRNYRNYRNYRRCPRHMVTKKSATDKKDRLHLLWRRHTSSRFRGRNDCLVFSE